MQISCFLLVAGEGLFNPFSSTPEDWKKEQKEVFLHEEPFFLTFNLTFDFFFVFLQL